MDFWAAMTVLVRRWYVTLPVFVLALGAAGALYLSRPVVYVSYSVLALTAPASGGSQRADPRDVPDLTNPLLNFYGAGLNNTAAILIQALNAPVTSDQLGVGPNGDPTFRAGNGTSNPELLISGPFVVVTAQSASPGKAQDLAARVTQRARQELVLREQELKAPPATYVVLSEIVPPTTPQPLGGTRLRPAASAFALGCIASIAVAFGFESIMTRPGRRRRAQSETDAHRTVGPPVDSEGTDVGQATAPSVASPPRPLGVAILADEREV